MPGDVNPALVIDVRQRMASGWTFEVEGRVLKGTGPDGAAVAISCDNEDAARALLDAAQG